MQTLPVLPETGYLRLPQVLSIYPVSRSTWWAGVRNGRYPKPVRLGARCVAWCAEDIRALLESIRHAGGE
jgi:prophage regulatory protein